MGDESIDIDAWSDSHTSKMGDVDDHTRLHYCASGSADRASHIVLARKVNSFAAHLMYFVGQSCCFQANNAPLPAM